MQNTAPDVNVMKGALPSNVEMEQMLLGAILNNNNHIEKIIEILKPDDFFVPFHQEVFKVILSFTERYSVATPVSIKNYVDQQIIVNNKEKSGFEYLVEITSRAQLVHDVSGVANLIHDLFLRRQLIMIAEEAIQYSYKENVNISANDRIEHLEQILFNLSSSGELKGDFIPLKNSLSNTLQKIKDAKARGGLVNGISTKLIEIDKITGGLQNSDLVILAARPSMGKTSLAINIGVNAAESFAAEAIENNHKAKAVAFFSLEMSADQIAARILSMKTGIEGSKIRSGHINREEFDTISTTSAKIGEMNFFIDDTPALSISGIRTRARRMKRQQNIGLIIIDYLQLARGTGYSKEMNRVQEIGEISQGLKAIAKELNIPVLALSQLSRAVESREDKRPLLSDLRESGNIEQDADVVMFIYREEYYLRNKDSQLFENQEMLSKIKNLAEVIVSKQRNGPTGKCILHFNANTTNFTNLDNEYA